jgi:hypothetical protein
MSHGQGAQQRAEKKLMSRPSSAPPAAFMTQLMALVDPHQTTPNEALRRAQGACGRWIGLRRLHLDLSSSTLAGMANITRDDILLIESGLAAPQIISAAARQQLSVLLAPNRTEKAWVADVIAIALGQVEALNELTLNRVFDELEEANMSAEERDRMLATDLAEQPAPNPEAAAEPIDREVFSRERGMFEVLRALVNGASHIPALLARLQQDSPSIGLAQIGVLINRMQRNGIVSAAGELRDPAYPDEAIPIYRVTSKGRHTFNAERTHRLVVEAKVAAATAAAASAAAPDVAPGGSLPEPSG